MLHLPRLRLLNGSKWISILSSKEKELVKEILTTLDLKVKSGESIFPKPQYIFRALDKIEETKVVILGQDPYYREGQANGFAFAVNQGIVKPPTLVNIFKELNTDIGSYEVDQTLEHWSNQGVLLLNNTLTVSEGKPGSHVKLGWHKITNKVIKHLSDTRQNLVFILWGKPAQTKAALIDDNKHHIISSPHPSPLSAYLGFFGSKPFSRTNQYLIRYGISPIRW